MSKKSINFMIIAPMLLFVSICNAQSKIVVDTFSNCQEKELPCKWEKNGKSKGVHVMQENGNYYVNLSSNSDVQRIGKEIKYSIMDYPVLSWKWRVHELPVKGKEDVKKLSNSAAGIYVVFSGGIPFGKAIKYVWSTTLPVGTILRSPFSNKTAIIVVATGSANLNTWISEKRNVVEDYRAAFKSKPSKVKGIGLITSSDNSKSKASADYDDIIISK